MDVDNQAIEISASGDPRYNYRARPRPDSDIGMQPYEDILTTTVVQRTLTSETPFIH